MNPEEDERRWSEAIAEASEKVRRDAPPASSKPEEPSARRLLVGLVVGILSGMLSFNLSPPPELRLPPAEQAVDLKREVAVVVQVVQAHLRATGELPPRTLLAPYLESGYEYEVLAERPPRFAVARSAGGASVRYDSATPLEDWLTNEEGAP